jgi:hypothetical protein
MAKAEVAFVDWTVISTSMNHYPSAQRPVRYAYDHVGNRDLGQGVFLADTDTYLA